MERNVQYIGGLGEVLRGLKGIGALMREVGDSVIV